MDALSIGEISMINDLRQIEISSHNLANVNTTAYKRQLPVIRAFSEHMNNAVATPLISVSGSAGSAFPRLAQFCDITQGAIQFTFNPLDVAIEGEGFFEVRTPVGTRYTRDGAFEIDSHGRLVTRQGYPVLSANGEIRLTDNSPEINQDGQIWEGDELSGQVKLIGFRNGSQLENLGNGLYASKGGGGEEVIDTVAIRQNHLESANVDAADEMIRAVSVMRHIEATQRVMKYYDQMLGEAISTIAEF